MAYDLETVTSAPAVVEAGGCSLLVGPLSLREVGLARRALAAPGGAGVVEFLFLLVAKHRADFGRAEAAALAERLGPGDFERLSAAAYGERDPHADRRASSGPAAWGEIFHHFAKEYGWTAAEVGELTLPQVSMYLAKGKAGPSADAIPLAEVAETIRERRRAMGLPTTPEELEAYCKERGLPYPPPSGMPDAPPPSRGNAPPPG